MFPVNTFKKRIIFDFLNSRGSNSMFPFTAESGKERPFSTPQVVSSEKERNNLPLFKKKKREMGGSRGQADLGNDEMSIKKKKKKRIHSSQKA